MTGWNEKVVVVTGASRGLGEAMARGFAAQGAHLVLAARDTADLDRVGEQCQAAGAAGVTIVPTDVTSESDVQALTAAAADGLGRLDVFVANAGTSYGMLTDKRYTDLPSYDLDIVEQLFQVNAIGMWLCMKAALPRMKAGASFIAIGSETGRIARAGSGVYAVTKACVDVLVTIAAGDMAEKQVRVNCLTPGGMVDTQLFGPNKMPEFLKNLPMSTTDTDVIVPAALWLASDETADITGIQLAGTEFNKVGAEGILAALSEGDASKPMPTRGTV
jgi:NAD(P)-dependent dehydrogenase (short-subunit alcohol dehydrogenase family)